MKYSSNIDSKYRFVILAAKRAKMLLKGAKPKVKSKHKNPIRIAQNEVLLGAIDYEILQTKKEEIVEPEEQLLAGDETGEEIEAEREEFREEEEAGEEESEEDEEEEVEEELLEEEEGEEKEDEG